jgi:hypothetical protein
MQTHSMLAVEMQAMIAEGMQPYDCLMYAIAEGVEYPDAVYLVTRALRLDDDQVFELEESYN